jgi:hypothetical protein
MIDAMPADPIMLGNPGYIGIEHRPLQPLDNRFGLRLLPGLRTILKWRATTDDDEHYVYAIAL